ncbi:hypothetical protein H6G74_05570 [Nostoc spongiaeforme FACHB-130]|uniref:Uncharacterized protein n=1 Tax=Nostoc spongiaeforme FACHB-130 TaxID=1357510 RepID=A0ABR8FQX0_9NOSO|nr:hypothetical protein [Nostoc spongiaeforme]MBD2593797.1 hypothetical protein [Nostoc spongiaeforme FACHB-130]
MAWIFSLSAECGSDETTAHKFAQHFIGQIFILSNGSSCLCHVDTFQDIESNWWCRVYPSNISEVGIDSPESAYLMTELGILLYQKLRLAPPFRYALVGVEVDEFRTYSELIEDLPNLSIPGLVLSQIIEQEAAILPIFRQFSSGYIWQPYQGEIYNPLMVSPELKTKLDELLVIR